MEKESEKPNPAEKVKLEKKYIRLQQVGIGFLVSIQLVVYLLVVFDFYIYVTVVMALFSMITTGIICIALGEEGRNALRASSDNDPGYHAPPTKVSEKSNTNNCPIQ